MSLHQSELAGSVALLKTDVRPLLSRLSRSTTAMWVAWASVALVIAVAFGFGWWLQSGVLINHDVGWIVRSAGWLLDGKRFGSQIVDSNPPLIWFLSIPAAVVVRAGWLSEVDAIRTYFWLLCVGSLALSHFILKPLRDKGGKIESASILVGLALVFAVLPQAAFGQREYLAFVLCMPYALLIAGRLACNADFSRGLAIGTGVLAGIAFALKPWLLSAPLALELVHLLHLRSLRRTFRPETVALAGTFIAYAFIVVAFTPDYFVVSVPLARDVYWMFGRKTPQFMWDSLLQEFGLVLIAILIFLCIKSFSAYARVLAALLLGFAVNYWFQRKGFGYHLYPVIATSLVILLYASAHGCKRILIDRNGSVWRQFLTAPCVVTLTIVGLYDIHEHIDDTLHWAKDNGVRTSLIGERRHALIERLASLTEGDTKRIYVFSTVPFPAYPTLNYLNVEAGNSQLCLYGYTAYLKRHLITDERKLRAAERGMATQREIVLREFLAQPPDIVLINPLVPGPDELFDFIEHFSSDPRFAAEWSNYVELEPHGKVRIFARRTSRSETLLAKHEAAAE